MSAITLDGSMLKFAVTVIGGSYEGTMSPDGTTVTGTLTGRAGARADDVRARHEGDRMGDSATAAAGEVDGCGRGPVV